MTKTLSAKALNIILSLNILIVFLILLAVPLVTTAFFKSAFMILNQKLVFKTSFCIYLISIPYIIALFKLKTICKLVVKDTPFSLKSSKSLNHISICAFSEILLVLFSSLFLKYFTSIFHDFKMILMVILVAAICIPIGLLCLVLSKLFISAKEIKDENDQTI